MTEGDLNRNLEMPCTVKSYMISKQRNFKYVPLDGEHEKKQRNDERV